MFFLIIICIQRDRGKVVEFLSDTAITPHRVAFPTVFSKVTTRLNNKLSEVEKKKQTKTRTIKQNDKYIFLIKAYGKKEERNVRNLACRPKFFPRVKTKITFSLTAAAAAAVYSANIDDDPTRLSKKIF